MNNHEDNNIEKLASSLAKKQDYKKIHSYYKQPNMLGKIVSKEKKINNMRELDEQDILKTFAHQKNNLNKERLEVVRKFYREGLPVQEDFKYFVLVASQANYRKLDHIGYYKILKSQASKYPPLFFICIDKDIPRTLVDGHPFQPALRNILYCYAMRNPALLYCQGMNYIVAFLLINGFTEEQGFWFLVQLVEDIVMPNYFKDLTTISVNVTIFEQVIKQIFPDFYNQMESVGMQSGIFLVPWFICLFTKGFINTVSQYLLQTVILETRQCCIGFALIKISIGILAALFTREQKFQFQKDFKSLKQSIDFNVQDMSLEQLKRGLQYFEFNYRSYDDLLRIYKPKQKNNLSKLIETQLKQKKVFLPNCDQNNPVCLQRVEIEKKIGSVEQVVILKNKILIEDQIKQNYFFTKNIQRGNPKIVYQSPQQCPITHHLHVCQSQSIDHFAHKHFQTQKQVYNPTNQQLQYSFQTKSRYTRVEDKFHSFSSFFIIDEKQDNCEKEKIEEEGDGEEDFEMLSVESSIEEQLKLKDNKQKLRVVEEEKQKKNIFKSLGNYFKKTINSIKVLKTDDQQKYTI